MGLQKRGILCIVEREEQLNTGEWAHKQGSTASQNLGYVNPSDDAVWNGYQGETLYFVVTAP